MRDQYWNFYVSIKHKSLYYKHFQFLFSAINWTISTFLCLTTLSCIATLNIWKSQSVIWASIICISQVIQALFPKLPYNDLLITTRFMACSVDKLLIDIDYDWLCIDVHSLTDNEILERLQKHEKHYSELANQFFAGTYLPVIKHCEKKAEKECKNFFFVRYQV